jgi:hypothetical protein
MVRRSGGAVIRLLDNVRQKTIKPFCLSFFFYPCADPVDNFLLPLRPAAAARKARSARNGEPRESSMDRRRNRLPSP